MGIAGGPWRIETSVTRSVSSSILPRKRAFRPDGDFRFEKTDPFSGSIPGWMTRSAVVRDYRALEVGRRRANRLVLTIAG